MATDKSEPKYKLIIGIGLGSAISLVCIRAGLVTYFNTQVDEELYAKRGSLPHPELREERQRERELLTNTRMPIDKAMEVFASQGRPAALTPEESKDMSAVQQRWKLLPPPPAPESPLPEITPAPTNTVAADGGVTTATMDAAAPQAESASHGADASTRVTNAATKGDAGTNIAPHAPAPHTKQ